jgi:predicted carbohydrate-binding protein with CBM5 and CBM33 domain
MEWLTEKGWRSENAISENQLEKLYFNNDDGSKKVKELKADCRIPAMKKSIILNYS